MGLVYKGIWSNHTNRDRCIETYVMAMAHHPSTKTNFMAVYEVLSIALILAANNTDCCSLVRLQQEPVVYMNFVIVMGVQCVQMKRVYIILLILLIQKEVDLEISCLNIQAKYFVYNL